MGGPVSKQTGRYLVVTASLLALCGAVAAEPTPAPASTPGVADVPPGPPVSEGLSAPSAEQAPAQGAAPPSVAGWKLPPIVPRPDFISRRPFIPDFLLKDKREGRFITGAPGISYDQQAGLVLAVIGFLFDNGTKDDPFFRTAPYRQRIAVTAVGSLSGLQDYAVALDQPNLFDSPYRLRALVEYEVDPLNNYFGIGTASMRDFRFPGEPGRLFSTYNSYQDALRREVNGFAYTEYDRYESRQTTSGVTVERDLFGGIVRPLVGLRLRYTDIHDVTGDRVDAEDATGHSVRATQQPTRMHTDCLAGEISGCHGGFENLLTLGLSVDTLDFEPDPYSGLLAQVVAEFSGKALGSDFEYERVTSSITGYRAVFPNLARLVLAGRFLYSAQFGTVPFFSLPTLALNTGDRSGLGGFHTMRGFVDQRFVGDSAVVANAELRWSLYDGGYLFGQHLRPMLAPFVDAGRVFDARQLYFFGWRADGGIGFRLIWNLATTVSFDFGFSNEGQTFFMNLGYAF